MRLPTYATNGYLDPRKHFLHIDANSQRSK